MLGVIADDVTGATDVALALRRNGLRTHILFSSPCEPLESAADAIVIALKTRMLPPQDAVALSVRAAEFLRASGANRYYLKYCSTFDSTEEGNIGPVLEALMGFVDTPRVVTTPSTPGHDRTVYGGTLSVRGVPLAESSMRDHPLTPMRDSSLQRLLEPQVKRASVVILGHSVVRAGVDAVDEAVRAHPGPRILLADAITDDDLAVLARVVVTHPLAAGAAGFAAAIGRELARSARGTSVGAARLPVGPSVVLAGSCSARTLQQIQQMREAGRPTHRLDALTNPQPRALAEKALAWFDASPHRSGALIYSSLPPDHLREVQHDLGVERSSVILEEALGLVARGLRARGVTRIIAAGGETSGAIIAALDVRGGSTGAEVAPGVPWIHTEDGLDLLLKSGNFGDPDLLVRASAEAADLGH